MATSSQRLRKCQWIGLTIEIHWHRQVFWSLDTLSDKQHHRAQVHVPREDWDLTSMLRCLVAQSCPTLCDPVDCSPPGSSVHGDSQGKDTGVGCHALLQGIFPTQGLNLGLPHWQADYLPLSYLEGPRTLEWVAYPFSKGTFQPRNWTRVSWFQADSVHSWATQEAQLTSSQTVPPDFTPDLQFNLMNVFLIDLLFTIIFLGLCLEGFFFFFFFFFF